ncbi:long-chain fatty acid transporter-like protein, partial [Plenodomus tracheiphilus IPT5]
MSLLALPAAAAGLAYLNARYGLVYDYQILSSFLRGSLSAASHERSDTLNNFYELELHAKSSRAHHPFIIFHGQSWTYAQAYETVLKYATWLTAKGVGKDDIVAMDFLNSEVFVWVWFALWSVGAKPAFINTNLRGKALVHTVKTSTARLVLVDDEGREKYEEEVLKEYGFNREEASRAGRLLYTFDMDQSEVPKSVRNQTTTPQAAIEAGAVSELLPLKRELEVVCFDRALRSHILSLAPTRLPDSSRDQQTSTSMAMLIYTSGTTGLPKPAIMTWVKATGAAKSISLWFGLKKEVIYTSMPLYHSSASILGVCAVLHGGGTISLSQKFSHKTFWPEVIASGATILHYVGETCRYLLSAPPTPLDKQHKIHTAFGNGLRPDVWEPFQSRFGITNIYELYAATEAPGVLFNYSANSFSSGAIGRTGLLYSLLMGKSTAIIRIDTSTSPPTPLRSPPTTTNPGFCQPCPPNIPGEILFALDPNNPSERFQGYFHNPSATTSKILRNVFTKGDAWFRSGDLVRRDSQGRWWFVDRLGDTFRWKAENVSTTEVAEVVGRFGGVSEANVYGVGVPGHDGRAGCAAVVLRGGSTAVPGSMGMAGSDGKEKLQLPTQEMLRELAEHVIKELPSFARPLWIRVTRQMA